MMGSIGCNTVFPIVKVAPVVVVEIAHKRPHHCIRQLNEPFFPCMQSARFD